MRTLAETATTGVLCWDFTQTEIRIAPIALIGGGALGGAASKLTAGTEVIVTPSVWRRKTWIESDARGVIVRPGSPGRYVVRHNLSGTERVWNRRDLERVPGMQQLAEVLNAE